jgi:3-keto-disaccharide hydrolase
MFLRMSAVVLVVASLANAQPTIVDKDAPVALFNGKDLTGWTFHLDKKDVPMEDVWSVKDGKLLCKGKPAGYLLTKKNDYENYVLTLQWRWPGKGGNNGVLVHVTKPGELGVWPKSLEVQLADKNAGDFWVIGTTIDVPDVEKRRKDRRHLNLTDDSEKPLGEWNDLEITCRGDEVIVKVNGVLVNHATKVSQTKGAIALQSEGTPIEFRNIKLRNITKK